MRVDFDVARATGAVSGILPLDTNSYGLKQTGGVSCVRFDFALVRGCNRLSGSRMT
jgi:hypothetical protein